jgi:uncharacterized protein (DUF1697 family)
VARYVALFRGINVGKAKRIAMADLRALLEDLGYSSVQTLLNSGNAVFTAPTAAARTHATRIRAAVGRKLGVDALVIVRSAREIAAICRDNALASLATDDSRLLVLLTAEAKALSGLKALAQREWGEERVHLGRQAGYIWCARGILESAALEALMRAAGPDSTTRNWATLQKIRALLAADGR